MLTTELKYANVNRMVNLFLYGFLLFAFFYDNVIAIRCIFNNSFRLFNSFHLTWRSKSGYLDNTKHIIFWLCNLKQLNFWHFNNNSKKFFETIIFSRKKQKRLQKGQYYFISISRSFRSFYDNSGLFQKIS